MIWSRIYDGGGGGDHARVRCRSSMPDTAHRRPWASVGRPRESRLEGALGDVDDAYSNICIVMYYILYRFIMYIYNKYIG